MKLGVPFPRNGASSPGPRRADANLVKGGLFNVRRARWIRLFTSLYTLVSDEAIHPLIAPREYCRLFRNIVIEYGLLFLTTIQNKGVTVKAAAKP
jgi:hypothetical protein